MTHASLNSVLQRADRPEHETDAHRKAERKQPGLAHLRERRGRDDLDAPIVVCGEMDKLGLGSAVVGERRGKEGVGRSGTWEMKSDLS